MGSKEKSKYRGFETILQKWIYIFAYSDAAASNLMRAQVLKINGKYNFDCVEKLIIKKDGDNKDCEVWARQTWTPH